ncbi:hypothetical protein HPULCUR_007572 [Helicostylum pulchrum]|uniref:Phosphatase PP2A regulatory subunit A/Splicing factor 3B subunit 1-like HEAT repeat domain-containing protein n=1 Tax=Helicostylum pulchrum TaxID=562976 RepID=A0ABP9Y548_9FUNG
MDIEYMDEDVFVPRLENAAFTLISELKSEQVSQRLHALNKISFIANALGAEGTRTKLVPYLSEMKNDEESVLLLLAEQLIKLVEQVGGSSYVHVLLSPLEDIASSKECSVRDKVVESMSVIIQLLSKTQLMDHVYPLLARLGRSELFTCRYSAAGIIPILYALSDQIQRTELKILFTDLVNDSDEIVRSATLKNLPKLFHELEPDQLLTEGYAGLERLSTDDKSYVRVFTSDALITLSQLINDEQKQKYVLPILHKLSVDSCWRVRYVLAHKYTSLLDLVKDQAVKDQFIIPFQKLMTDTEGEVRDSTIFQLVKLSSCLNQEQIIQYIVPFLESFVNNEDKETRDAISTEIIGISALIGNEGTTHCLLPLFLKLLLDQDPQVKLNMISNLDVIVQAFGSNNLSQHVIPAISSLSKDKDWRTRLTMIELTSFITDLMGKKFFHQQLWNMYIAWLNDPVFSIRKAASINLKSLTGLLGPKFVKQTLLDCLIEMSVQDHHKTRITALFALTSIAEVLSAQDTIECILPTLLTLAKDAVPNIRFNVAKSLETLTGQLKKTPIYKTKVKPVLESLAKDEDHDVLFFAKRAIEHGESFTRPNL